MKRKSNGQGHTYKVGNSYKTVIRHNGRVVTAMASTPQLSKQRAKDKVSGNLGKLNEEFLIPAEERLVSEYLLNWLENEHQQNIAHTTFKRYRSLIIHHINPQVGSLPLSEVTPRLIAGLLNEMRLGGQSIRSQQQARAVISIALTEAVNQNFIDANPVLKVKNPQLREKSISPLNLDEVRLLFATFEGTYLLARLHIALLCGLRQGEALGLRWQDLDWVNGFINVQVQIQYVNNVQEFTTLKTTRSKRRIALTEETLLALKNHHKLVLGLQNKAIDIWNEHGLVFPRNDGTPRSPQTDYQEWRKALILCGIAPKRLHDARHTAATLLYSSGVGVETISRILGHSSSAITSRIYVHSAEQPLIEAAKAIDAILK